jgi:hypothetical protein
MKSERTAPLVVILPTNFLSVEPVPLLELLLELELLELELLLEELEVLPEELEEELLEELEEELDELDELEELLLEPVVPVQPANISEQNTKESCKTDEAGFLWKVFISDLNLFFISVRNYPH